MILFSAAGLFTATRFTGAEDQSGRPILNPQNVPSWFKTGRFRSARWDGGPLEAEKGILTGWINYTRDDPRQVLKATRDWYNPRTIEFLKKAHINWVWVTWSNGFSPATERAQQETLTCYIELCHQNNIRVAAYFSVGNMFWKDMFDKVPGSIAWVDRLEDGSPRFYTRPNRYMADITHPDWLELQRQRVRAAARAGADAFWIDNTFGYCGREKVTHFLDEVYDAASQINPAIVFMSNYNRTILTWGRLQNGVTTEDGEEPGYYTGTREGPPLVTNAGILRHEYGVGEGWRPVSVEFGGRRHGERITTPLAPSKWQLAIAECAMYGVSFEPYFEGLFLRDLYFGIPEALRRLEAIGHYNAFLERQEEYYTHPESTARVAVISDTTDEVIPFLSTLSSENLNYDVKFNYQHPTHEFLEPYKVIVLPNTNPLGGEWREALDMWVGKGGTVIAVQDASMFSPGASAADQEMELGTILGVSRRSLPAAAHENPRGKGLAIYLPELPPAREMVKLIRRHLGDSELVEIERRPAILSNLIYQSAKNRTILHLLNYRQDLQQDLRVRVRFPVKRVEIFSPDALVSKTATVARRGGEWEVVVPELQTYDLVAIYAERK
jgi:hypothetical protein